MNQERVFQVLLGPHVSEKTTIAGEKSNQYVFRVAVNATKLEVRRAVEQLFKVEVSGVQTLKVKGKVKRKRFGYSRRPNWKKAYVRLQEGHAIDLLSLQ